MVLVEEVAGAEFRELFTLCIPLLIEDICTMKHECGCGCGDTWCGDTGIRQKKINGDSGAGGYGKKKKLKNIFYIFRYIAN